MSESEAPPASPRVEPLLNRDVLIAAITAFLANQDAQMLNGIRESLERAVDEAGPDALTHLAGRLASAGEGWDYYPRDPLARRIHQLLAERILKHDSVLLGVEHLAAVADKPVVIIANHLSYSDANLLEVLLHREGGAALSDRLTVIAGPKVYRASSGVSRACASEPSRRRRAARCPRKTR